jgi:hypothetical protein
MKAAACALVLVLAWLSPLAAHARPGTPKDLRVFECDPSFHDSGNAYYHPSPNHYDNPPLPGLCVTFTNTATERVVFEYQMTAWGTIINHAALHYDCLTGFAQAYSCVAADNFGGDFIPFAERNKDNPEWASEGFKITDLDFQKQYCVHVRARDYSGPASGALAKPLSEQEVSLQWTDWTCAITSARPVAPQPPPQPVAPKLSVAITKHGDQVTATWQGANYVGYYTVDAKTACKAGNAPLLPAEMQGQVSDRAYTFTLNVAWADAMDMQGNAYVYRVCAHNDSGRACSDWESSSAALPACVTDAKLIGPKSTITLPTPPKTRGELEATQTIGNRMAYKPPPPVISEPGGVAGPAPAMTGAFDTDFGMLTLSRTDGSYSYKDGRVVISKIVGDFMDGTWTQSSSGQECSDGAYRGTFHFRFSRDGFTGSYGYCDGPTSAGPWNGRRRPSGPVVH